MKPISRWSYTTSLCLLVAFTGCHHVDPLVFNQKLDDDNKKLNAAGVKMGVALRGALENQPGGVDKFKTEYTGLQQTVTQIKKEVETMEVPDDASSKALYAAYQKFLGSQESMVANEFTNIMKCVDNKSLSAMDKANTIRPIVLSLQQREETDLSTLKAAQHEFATEHHITLK
ncbi:MAG: hypothetical protein JWN14_2862 [Chthonomonadales bacterium]|nr:hypothetical protein [Chthonomonadales bacterium]